MKWKAQQQPCNLQDLCDAIVSTWNSIPAPASYCTCYRINACESSCCSQSQGRNSMLLDLANKLATWCNVVVTSWPLLLLSDQCRSVHTLLFTVRTMLVGSWCHFCIALWAQSANAMCKPMEQIYRNLWNNSNNSTACRNWCEIPL